MWEDPIVAEVRKHRKEIAAQFNYDIVAMFKHYQEIQRSSGRKYASFSPRRIEPEQEKNNEEK